jgi:hypothetical protein
MTTDMQGLIETLRADAEAFADEYDESTKEETFQWKLADEVERLCRIEAAAKNLIAVKGRHHSEMAYKRLEEELK